ncbi:23S rRNA (adenine(2503)-C(2))-methyltransferase RlmN [Acholeplasma equirhinis]|uniref:23S rRNA (adenine(2503)-C(2))-methyltransferase RlmN n=1 Tax=Acholeplasma equirhinis TaxID=555393 RepID=UPI00197B00D7|nr:23S rRNA (adenine(2503)-C(2))-methyltransferase RlmN [Acholeplasma equirhinis]MBN3490792.1 23S rRNA (adenine(2503)-C(2))-methyltransferase RlmN [Acholeplasma equirhinis]
MTLIYDLTFEELEEFIVEKGFPKYRAGQVWHWIYVQKIDYFNQMNNVPQGLVDVMTENFTFDSMELVIKNVSDDGTIKFLYDLHDANLIETVLMKHNYGMSACVTTQVGCNIGCSFCASGVLKKQRDLSAGEIVGQIIKTEKDSGVRISSIVIMGIGEPFDNYKNLVKFFKIVNHPKGLAIGARHITVSTSGLVPKIKEFAHLGLQVNLAVSLHAPNNEIRSKLMKINDRFKVEEVIDAIKYYIQVTNRRVTIEYIMIQEVNDSVETAKELAALLKGMNVYVNLIPYNKVKEAPWERSTLERREAFYKVLKDNKITAVLRREQGHDINAACGQLRSQHL